MFSGLHAHLVDCKHNGHAACAHDAPPSLTGALAVPLRGVHICVSVSVRKELTTWRLDEHAGGAHESPINMLSALHARNATFQAELWRIGCRLGL